MTALWDIGDALKRFDQRSLFRSFGEKTERINMKKFCGWNSCQNQLLRGNFDCQYKEKTAIIQIRC